MAATASVGCLKGKRPYTTTFTANLPTSTGAPGPNNDRDGQGLGPCSK